MRVMGGRTRRTEPTSVQGNPSQPPTLALLSRDSFASRRLPPHRGGKGDDDGAHPASSSLRRELGNSSAPADERGERNYGTDCREPVASRSTVPHSCRYS